MIKFPKEIKRILSQLQAEKFEAYCVGDCVRDSIGGMDPYAWDIATNAGFEDLKRLFPESETISEKYSTIRLNYLEDVYEGTEVVGEEGLIVDVYTYRNADNTFASTIEEDLARRDFTCDQLADNGIRFVDINEGQASIRKRLLKCVGNPFEVFTKNPIKMMKVLKMVSLLGFDLSKEVYEAVTDNYFRLHDCDMKALGEEFYELMGGANTGKALNMMVDMGILNVILGDDGVKRMTRREKSDLSLLCANVDRTHKVPERRLGLFYAVLNRRIAMPSIEKLQFDEDLTQKLTDAVKDMPKLYFCTNNESLKIFLYEHGMDRFEYLLNLEKAYRIVFETDIELKIRSQLYTLDQVKASGEPVFLDDLCIDATDIMNKGITDDAEEAKKLAKYVLEHCIYVPKDHNRERCLLNAERYKKNPVLRVTRKMKWMR